MKVSQTRTKVQIDLYCTNCALCVCHESGSCGSPTHHKRSPSSRTQFSRSIHLSLIITPSAVPIVTDYMFSPLTNLPSCFLIYLIAFSLFRLLCFLFWAFSPHNISLMSACDHDLPCSQSVYALFSVECYSSLFPLRGGFICVFVHF